MQTLGSIFRRAGESGEMKKEETWSFFEDLHLTHNLREQIAHLSSPTRKCLSQRRSRDVQNWTDLLGVSDSTVQSGAGTHRISLSENQPEGGWCV